MSITRFKLKELECPHLQKLPHQPRKGLLQAQKLPFQTKKAKCFGLYYKLIYISEQECDLNPA